MSIMRNESVLLPADITSEILSGEGLEAFREFIETFLENQQHSSLPRSDSLLICEDGRIWQISEDVLLGIGAARDEGKKVEFEHKDLIEYPDPRTVSLGNWRETWHETEGVWKRLKEYLKEIDSDDPQYQVVNFQPFNTEKFREN